MLPFCITILLYCFWTLLGVGVLAALKFGRHAIRNLLLAPVAGASVTLLAAFELNRLGLPVREFGAWLGAALLVLGLALCWIYRPRFPVNQVAPFAILLMIAAVVTFRPMFEFGFNWISYGNEDMTNYVLAAERVYDHGYWENPDPAVYAAGTDRSLELWFLHVELGGRSGAELLLAWLHSILGRTSIELFMPLIGTLHLMLIAAGAALVYRSAARRRAAQLTMFLLAGSALTTLGTLAQLIAQVWGLALVAAAIAILARRFDRLPRQRVLPYGILAGIVIAALVVSYPEILPFFGLPITVFAVVEATRRGWKPVLLLWTIMLGAAGVILSTYARFATGYFIAQLVSGIQNGGRRELLFPYFLVPSGLADLWGLAPINGSYREPWLSITILIGAALFLCAIATIAYGLKRMEPAALVATAMLAVAAQLFFTRTDFGLFKLAMYIQPFLLGTVSVAVLGFAAQRGRFPKAALIISVVVVAAGGWYTQFSYVERSSGEPGRGGGGLAEVPEASSTGMLRKLVQVRRTVPERTEIFSDTENAIIAKIEAGIFRGNPLVFPSDPRITSFSGGIPEGVKSVFRRLYFDPPGPAVRVHAELLRAKERETFSSQVFWRPEGREPDQFLASTRDGSSPGARDLITGPRYTPVNRRTDADPRLDPVVESSDYDLRNHLVLVSSRLCKPATWYVPSEVSLFSIEPDLAFPRSTMAGLGQYALFEILHPSPKGYLALSLTRTYSGDGDSRLPRGEALGTAVNPIVFIGRGSARVFVPVQPRQIAGRFYFALDMLSPPIRFAAHRSGMMALYGRDVQFDPRRLSGFAREISYISSEEFAATIPPRSLSDFPKDLANPALEYSGIYEDGWVAEDSSFRLMQGGSKALRIAGSIPASWKSAGNRVRLLEDGAEIASQPLTGGSFELTTDVASQPGPHQIRIQFASVSKLGPLDPRPAAARLSYLGFGPFAKADDIADSDRISFSSGWYDFERYRGQAFRWARSRASMHLNPERTERWLVADLEPNSGGRPATVIVVDGEGKVLFQQQLAGRREIKVPIGTAADLEIRIEGGLVKPSAADPRELAFRVFRLRLE